MAGIFIYGSCVSRDAFELMKPEHKLLAYVARQSLISATSRPTSLLAGPDLESEFQHRMVKGDLESNLYRLLQEHHQSIDVVLMDLTDERLGVMKLPDSTFITRSTELMKSGLMGQLETVPGTIHMGADRHFMFWSRSAQRFAALLEALGLLGKTLVLNTPWATVSTDGRPVHRYRDYDTVEMSGHLERYARYLEGLGFGVVDMPAELAVTTPDHKWGLEPFHYSDPAYEWIKIQVDHALSSRPATR